VISPAIILLVIFQFAYPTGLLGVLTDVVNWIAVTCADMSEYIVKAFGLVGGFVGKYILGPIFLVLLFYVMLMLAAFPICLILSFSMIYSMRAIGLVALYFRQNLDLVSETTAGDTCGFGPRHLAAEVDSLILFLLMAVLSLIAFLCGLLFHAMDAAIPEVLARVIYPIFALIIVPALYFARPQSAGTIRASIGKWSLGIVVTNEQDETMSFNEAVPRYFVKVLLAVVTLGASCIMSAFTPNKQALHDQMLHTKVAWKGDDERKRLE